MLVEYLEKMMEGKPKAYNQVARNTLFMLASLLVPEGSCSSYYLFMTKH